MLCCFSIAWIFIKRAGRRASLPWPAVLLKQSAENTRMTPGFGATHSNGWAGRGGGGRNAGRVSWGRGWPNCRRADGKKHQVLEMCDGKKRMALINREPRLQGHGFNICCGSGSWCLSRWTTQCFCLSVAHGHLLGISVSVFIYLVCNTKCKVFGTVGNTSESDPKDHLSLRWS